MGHAGGRRRPVLRTCLASLCLLLCREQTKMLPPVGLFVLLVLPTIISALNVLWFWKICRGVFKASPCPWTPGSALSRTALNRS